MKKVFTTIMVAMFLSAWAQAQIVPDSSQFCQASFYYQIDEELMDSLKTVYPYQFFDQSYNNVISRTWNFGDGTTSNEAQPLHYYSLAGDTVEVCLEIVSADNCISSYCERFVVGEGRYDCQIGFSISVLESFPPQYRFIPSKPDSLAQYYWDFGDGNYSNDMTPTHTYDFSDIYTVCLSFTSPNGCAAFACDTLYAQGIDQGCKAYWEAYADVYSDSVSPGNMSPVPNVFMFRDLSRGDVIQWKWDFGDGTVSDEQNPLHSYEKSGIFNVCLEILTSDNCLSTYCNTVYVYNPQYCNEPGTVKDYTGLDGCGLLIVLDNGIVLEPAEIVPDFVLYDGQRVQLSYTELKDRASICMAGVIARIDCISDLYDSVCMAGFIYYAVPWISSVPRLYQFEILDASNLISVLWDFGDGTTTNEFAPVHRFQYDGYYTVCVTISKFNGCTATACETSYFDGYNPPPGLCDNLIRLSTEILLNGQDCNGTATATLVDPQGYSVYGAEYYWSTGESGPVIYNLCPGVTYNVIAMDTSDCAVSGSFSFGGTVVYPDTLVGFWNYEQNNFDFVFNLPVYSDSIYCEWDFGDGESAAGNSVSHTYQTMEPQTVILKVFGTSGNMLFDQEILISPGEPTGKKEPPQVLPRVYPVPAHDWLYITLPGDDQRVIYIEVLTAGGQVVMHAPGNQDNNQITLNVSELPVGFYIGKLSRENGMVQTFRFVK
jgi:PKD repeat protein